MFWSYLLMTLLIIASVMLIIIILLQRGRGGGLAGAFGGLGGQSAFGTKAGDVFTKITIAIAIVWVLLAGLSGLALEKAAEGRFQANAPDQPVMAPGGGEIADPAVREADELEAEGDKPDESGTGGVSSEDAGESSDPPEETPTNPDSGEESGSSTGDADQEKTE